MIPRDKLLHIALGVLACVCALVALFIYTWFGLGPCLAYTTTVTGTLYEVQQWYRKEGQPDPMDAVATAAPGFVAWAILAA
jgi:flagellar basal body-associated protein FliL